MYFPFSKYEQILIANKEQKAHKSAYQETPHHEPSDSSIELLIVFYWALWNEEQNYWIQNWTSVHIFMNKYDGTKNLIQQDPMKSNRIITCVMHKWIVQSLHSEAMSVGVAWY